MDDKINNLKDKVQQLISQETEKDEKGKEILSVNLDTGKSTPNPAEEFLKKHGIKNHKK
ncbi:MAG: hypothetical protein I3273_03765 [Candidatus Moeniiplasma glomeromycotorum]|nr:hypothetical protein [Candidatus Moeniiplasma glomeromycotorum]MCE8169213.1 hypothetical protein [Candidatus Moeniiplasma glomeromycotorum]